MVHLLLLVIFSTVFAVKWNELNGYNFGLYKEEFNKVYTINEETFRKNIFESNLKQILKHNYDPTKTWKANVNQFTDRNEVELKAYLGNKIGFRQNVQSSIKNKISKLLDNSDRTNQLISGNTGRTNQKKKYQKYIGWANHIKYKISENTGRTNQYKIPENIDWANHIKYKIPENIDWRNHNIITPVKNQGHCGSCYSFSAAQSVESYYALATGKLETLSEQQILDCSPDPKHCGGFGGCGGSTEENAFKHIIRMGGLSAEWTYPYVSYFGQNFECNLTKVKPKAKISDYVKLPLNDYEAMIYHVGTKGPLSVSVDATEWFRYSEGIFNGCNQTTPDLNHAVQLVGYGNLTEEGEYWIVRNSWGPDWGENGYIRLYKSPRYTCGIDVTPQNGDACDGDNNPITVCGTCGILYSGVYPIV